MPSRIPSSTFETVLELGAHVVLSPFTEKQGFFSHVRAGFSEPGRVVCVSPGDIYRYKSRRHTAVGIHSLLALDTLYRGATYLASAYHGCSK